jgi:large repetitive protein
VTVTGSIARLNAALSGLVYTPTSGYTGSDSLAISLHDTADNLSASANVALTVSNSAPAIAAPATASLPSRTSTLVFSTANNNAISITDVNAGSAAEPLTLTATNGTLNLGSTTGITITAGANGSASMTISGTLAALNGALSGLTFVPINAGKATIVLSYTDVGNGLKASATINITIAKVTGGGGGGGPVLRSPGSANSAAIADQTTASDAPMPPDAMTQWQGLAAAVEMLSG